MSEYAEAVPIDELGDAFANPPQQFGPIAFWFLNDRCDPEELDRQLIAFAEAGFGGVCPCARIGLDPAVGYLTEAWFAVLDRVMARCRELGLKVILYDEASYPSGSANGAVVAANPEHMARGLVLGDSVTTIDGVITDTDPATVASKQVWTSTPKPTWTRPDSPGYWRPTTGRSLIDRLVTVVAGRLDESDRIESGSLQLLQPGNHHLVRLESDQLPGRWRLMALFDVPTGGRIRGAYAHTDDGSALAPAAASLLDPDAVNSFIALTHDAYAEHLGHWFGDPIVGWFTDEPHLLGRGHRRDAQPWTPQLLDDLEAAIATSSTPDRNPREAVLSLLPSLFVPYDDDHGFVRLFAESVTGQLAQVYYGAQRRWCDEHGLALTGHPSEPDELTALDHFTWPGQDAVWRWVLPGDTALSGRESASARTAASTAEHRGIRTVVTEALGAYGWQLSLDEAKWLLDWHLVRGTTTFLLHAFFLSVRGNRAFESEPDLGLHNAWWPHFAAITRYLARTSMVLRGLQPIAEVAVLVDDDRATSDGVAELYQHQIGFRYATAEQIVAQPGRYRMVAVAPEHVDSPSWKRIQEAGITVRVLDGGVDWPAADADLVVTEGMAEDLRVARFADPEGNVWRLLTNEGEQPLAVTVPTECELWDAWTGRRWPSPGNHTVPRRGSIILAPAGRSEPLASSARPAGSLPGGPRTLTDWRATRADDQAWTGPDLGDWTVVPRLETWAGSVRYQTRCELADLPDHPVPLDLGEVGELARVTVNGQPCAELLWAPYRTLLDPNVLRAGENVIEILVSNSSANHYEGALRPSGLIGPVVLG